MTDDRTFFSLRKAVESRPVETLNKNSFGNEECHKILIN